MIYLKLPPPFLGVGVGEGAHNHVGWLRVLRNADPRAGLFPLLLYSFPLLTCSLAHLLSSFFSSLSARKHLLTRDWSPKNLLVSCWWLLGRMCVFSALEPGGRGGYIRREGPSPPSRPPTTTYFHFAFLSIRRLYFFDSKSCSALSCTLAPPEISLWRIQVKNWNVRVFVCACVRARPPDSRWVPNPFLIS